jgi:hypothetical protein
MEPSATVDLYHRMSDLFNSFIFKDNCFKSPAPPEPSHGHATDTVSVASVPPLYPSRPTDTYQERAVTENDICPLPPAYIPPRAGDL